MLESIVTKNKPHEAEQGLGQNRHAVESGLSNVARRALTDCRCSRADLTPPVSNAEHGKAVLRATPFVAAPTARQGSGGSIEKTEQAKARV